MFKLISSAGESLKTFLTFNHAERRGIMALVIIILVAEATNTVLPSMVKQERHDFTEFEQELKKFEAALNQPDTTGKYREAPGQKRNFKPTPQYKKQEPAPRQLITVELNTADSAQLLELYGIGPSFANRIIKYRIMLGGFYEKDQLLEVYGMDSARLEMFSEQLKINTDSIRKIPVNLATFKELLKHPYLDYETVRDIVNYREYTAPITHPDTLRRIIGYEPMFEKIRHYMEYEIMNME